MPQLDGDGSGQWRAGPASGRLRALAMSLGLAWTLSPAAAPPESVALRYSAPILVQRPAAFVQLPLTAAAYGHSLGSDLQDLRIVDATGQRVPFALLAPRAAQAQRGEQLGDAVLYALPAQPATGSPWRSPVQVTVQGERITVQGLPRPAAHNTRAPSGGWLLDLGQRQKDSPAPQSLRLRWSGPAEFAAAFSFDTSDDLRNWRPGGAGQIMALVSPTGPLTQANVALPAAVGRFVRLVWADTAAAPVLTAAQWVVATHSLQALDAPAELRIAASAAPAVAGGATRSDAAAQGEARSLTFELGAVLPLVQVDLQLAPGTRVVPARVQGRDRVDQPWRDLASGVFYRLERDGAVTTSPPLSLQAAVRQVRVVPDARAGVLDAEQTQLVVRAALASLVFATQGQAPFTLQAGAAQAQASALPLATLVPGLEEERGRFGHASLGDWTEVAAVARAEASRQRVAALRPWLLWAVLIGGVAALGFMVFRLARGTVRRQGPIES